ncbi:MAG: YihY/virulence factor BrkB family protein [Vicinamibacterales bacterium]
MFAHFDMQMSPTELVKRTASETMKDDAMGLAAQLAYYFFLSLFPALLCLIALASLFPLQNFTGSLTGMLGPFVPAEVLEIIKQQMLKLADSHDSGLLSVGLLGAIWSSSAAMVAIVTTMNRAYDIDEGRPWWKVRIIAVSLTVGLAVFILVSFTLVVAGPEIAEALARHLGLGPAFVWTWKILQWPVAFALVAVALGLIYYFAPDAEQEWVWVTPGSILATALWLAGSLGFRYYVVNFGNYDAAYGAIGGIILLMLWFYLSGFVIIVGAEMNAEIEHASPWGKAPGEKVPGQKKKIGVAAAKAYREHGEEPPKAIRQAEQKQIQPAEAAAPATAFEKLLSYFTLYLKWRSRSKS